MMSRDCAINGSSWQKMLHVLQLRVASITKGVCFGCICAHDKALPASRHEDLELPLLSLTHIETVCTCTYTYRYM